DAPISHTPPSVSIGIAWIGLKWAVPCDIDLYSRASASSEWMFFAHVRTDDGFFNKDEREGTEGRFEFVEFTRAIDLSKAEVAINLYAADLPAAPEGVIRIWFAGAIYEAPFKLGARTGNRGALPMSGPYWLRIDLRKVVGLPAP